MTDFIALACPSCGGSLQITPDVERFACAHCGREHIVNRGGGIVTIKPIVERLAGIGAAADKTASELAIRRITEELRKLEHRSRELESRLMSFAQSDRSYYQERASARGNRKLGAVTGAIAAAFLTLALAPGFADSPSLRGLDLTWLTPLSCFASSTFGMISLLAFHTTLRAGGSAITQHQRDLNAADRAEYELTVAGMRAAQIELARHRKIVSS